jgi:hypothetical protein
MIFVSAFGAGEAAIAAATAAPSRVPAMPMSASPARKAPERFSLFVRGDAGYVHEDLPSLPGRAAGTFEQFATGHAQAFL